jgi:hypothetical protein
MTFAEKTEEAQGMRLHVDRGVLRDIIEARIASDKRRSYYTIGSVFSAMGFTLVALGSTNYTASTLFVLIGIFYYLCIVGVGVNYVDEEGTGEEVVGGDKGDVYDMTREEKLELVRAFIEELSGFEMTEEDIQRIVWPAYSEEEADEAQADQAQVDDVDVQVERAELEIQPEPVTENEIVVEEGDQADGPRLARAETSYSEGVVAETQTHVESAPPVLAEPPAEAQEAALASVEAEAHTESETKNNVEEESGSATPEASGASE